MPQRKPTTSPAVASWSARGFEDYRDVDGLQLPFRLRRTSGGETVEETIVDRYRINPNRQKQIAVRGPRPVVRHQPGASKRLRFPDRGLRATDRGPDR